MNEFLALKEAEPVMPDAIHKFLNRNSVIYSTGNVPGHKTSEIYQCMGSIKIWKCSDLRLSGFQGLPFFKSFESITFTNLKILYIGWNTVDSIQSLPRIRTENLEQMYLWYNDITQIRSLRKTNAPNLVLLSLKNNKIIQMDLGNESNWNSLKKVQLQDNGQTQVQIENFNFLAKTQVMKNGLILTANSIKRISQSASKKVLTEKSLPQ